MDDAVHRQAMAAGWPKQVRPKSQGEPLPSDFSRSSADFGRGGGECGVLAEPVGTALPINAVNISATVVRLSAGATEVGG